MVFETENVISFSLGDDALCPALPSGLESLLGGTKDSLPTRSPGKNEFGAFFQEAANILTNFDVNS